MPWPPRRKTRPKTRRATWATTSRARLTSRPVRPGGAATAGGLALALRDRGSVWRYAEVLRWPVEDLWPDARRNPRSGVGRGGQGVTARLRKGMRMSVWDTKVVVDESLPPKPGWRWVDRETLRVHPDVYAALAPLLNYLPAIRAACQAIGAVFSNLSRGFQRLAQTLLS